MLAAGRILSVNPSCAGRTDPRLTRPSLEHSPTWIRLNNCFTNMRLVGFMASFGERH